MISQKRKSSLILLLAGASAFVINVAAGSADESASAYHRSALSGRTVRSQLTSPFAPPPKQKSSFSESVKGGF